MDRQPIFLTAEWRHLLMLNYEIEARVLAPYVPAGTELDFFGDRTYVSLVGFRFLDTRLKGIGIPFHRNFDEVNLRFYIRRPHPEGVRRGVVFIKEIVPRFWISAVANLVYHENYAAHPMRHGLDVDVSGELKQGSEVEYAWRSGGRWSRIAGRIAGPPAPAAPKSEEQFITEHYWGYSKARDGTTVEYEVAHPSWKVYPVRDPVCDIAVEATYGGEFAEALSAEPTSAFVADGSGVSVHRGTRVTYDAGEPGAVAEDRARADDGETDAAWATA